MNKLEEVLNDRCMKAKVIHGGEDGFKAFVKDNKIYKISSKVPVKINQEIEIYIKPIINMGDMVFYLDDPKQIPYRWKVWDGAERDPEVYAFCNPKDDKFIAKVKCQCGEYK